VFYYFWYYFCLYFCLLNIIKVRVGHEDAFIAPTSHYGTNNNMTVADPIPDKYHFDYNAREVSNTSPTK
jgi:hypothetical protein